MPVSQVSCGERRNERSECQNVFFVVHCLDHHDALGKRLALGDAHKAYLDSAAVQVVISGPLLGADQEAIVGSMFLLEAGDRTEIEDFNRADPFSKGGVWKTVQIHPFNKRVDNRELQAGDSAAAPKKLWMG